MCSKRFLWIIGVSFAICGSLPASVSAQYVEQSQLVARNGIQAGWSVALSAAGQFALLGDPSAGANKNGQVFVFERSGAAWTQDQALGISFPETNLDFGWSVALPGSAERALVGVPGIFDGQVDVFRRFDVGFIDRWISRGSFIPVNFAPESSRAAMSVSISKDGSIAIAGGPGAEGNTGGAWVFRRAGDNFTLQGGKLLGTGAGGAAGQGFAVAISGDGKTALVGGPDDTGGAGAVWVFTGTNGRLSQQGSKLFGTGAVGNAGQGAAVALSFDGNTALVGGPADNNGVGAVWVFTRAGNGSWSQQGPKLVGANSLGAASQGNSVALDDDGNTAVLGGPGDNSKEGAAWVFTRSGGQWTQLGDFLSGTNHSAGSQQGYSIALSRDGNYLTFGGPGSSSAWVFTRFTGAAGATRSCYNDSVTTLDANFSQDLDKAAIAYGFANAEALLRAVVVYCFPGETH